MESVSVRLAILLGLMAALAVLEAVLPWRPQARGAGRVRANLLLTVLFLALNLLLTAALIGVAARLEREQFGVLAALPPAAGFVGAILILDFFAYSAHVLMHRVPWLWRVHRVHHSDDAVDVTTAFRQHPLETALRFAFTSMPAILLGASATATATYRLIAGINALLEHANVGLPPSLERWLNRVVVTPQMHKIHHADEAARTDSNYANIFSVFDRMFGTYTASTVAPTVRYGLALPGASHRSFTGLLRLPWGEAGPAVAAPRR